MLLTIMLFASYTASSKVKPAPTPVEISVVCNSRYQDDGDERHYSFKIDPIHSSFTGKRNSELILQGKATVSDDEISLEGTGGNTYSYKLDRKTGAFQMLLNHAPYEQGYCKKSLGNEF